MLISKKHSFGCFFVVFFWAWFYNNRFVKLHLLLILVTVMSLTAQPTAFAPTAFDKVATRYWQEYQNNLPIGGGMAYEKQVRDCQLDGSIDSLKTLDRLLIAVKKDIENRQMNEQSLLNNSTFRNFLLFLGFYAGRVLINQSQKPMNWLAFDDLQRHFNLKPTGVGQFYQVTALCHDTQTPPFFVLVVLGAKLFGTFNHKFTYPSTGQLAPESLYWAVMAQLELIGDNQNSMGQNTVAKNTTVQHTATQNTIAQNPVIQNTPSQNTASQNVASQNPVAQNLANQPLIQAVSQEPLIQPKANPTQNTFAQNPVAQTTPSQNTANQAVINQTQPNQTQQEQVKQEANLAKSSPTKPLNSVNQQSKSPPKPLNAADAQALAKRQQNQANQLAKHLSEVKQDLTTLPAINSNYHDRYEQVAQVLSKAEQLAPNREQFDKLNSGQQATIKQALALLEKLADNGNTNAMLRLAICAFEGVVMPKDDEQGFTLTKKAAEMNDIRAQKFLSRLYYQGLGTTASPQMGEMWLERAAHGGHDEAKKLQAQFTQIKIMKDDFKVEAQKDKRYMMMLGSVAVFLVILMLLTAKFLA